jgi:hypothetical protein
MVLWEEPPGWNRPSSWRESEAAIGRHKFPDTSSLPRHDAPRSRACGTCRKKAQHAIQMDEGEKQGRQESFVHDKMPRRRDSVSLGWRYRPCPSPCLAGSHRARYGRMADGRWLAGGGAKLFQRRPFLISGPLPRPETGSSTTHACGPRPRIRADFHKALRCAPGILFKASALLLVVLCQLPRFGPRKLARSWSTGWLECGNDFASWVRVRGLIKMRRAIIPSAPVLRVPASKIMRATATST